MKKTIQVDKQGLATSLENVIRLKFETIKIVAFIIGL